MILSGIHLSEQIIQEIVETVQDDMITMATDKEEEVKAIDTKAPGLEYIRILKEVFQDRYLFKPILDAKLVDSCDKTIFDNIDMRRYRYNDYNHQLCLICHALIHKQSIDIDIFRSFLAFSLVINLFSKKTILRTTKIVREEDIGKDFSDVDDLFFFRYEDDSLEKDKVLFHLKNAFAHGRIQTDGD